MECLRGQVIALVDMPWVEAWGPCIEGGVWTDWPWDYLDGDPPERVEMEARLLRLKGGVTGDVLVL